MRYLGDDLLTLEGDWFGAVVIDFLLLFRDTPRY